MLKQHLKSKYQNYSDKEIDEIIQKFIKEYLQKLENEENNENQELLEQNETANSNIDIESRASLAT